MALLRINASGGRPVTAENGNPNAALDAYLARLPHRAPLVIFTHGLRHSPFGNGIDPHVGLLSAVTSYDRHWKARSLVRGLHMGAHQRLAGHAIAFGWDGAGLIWAALDRACLAGLALARLMMAIRQARPDLRLGVLTHSLGARVVLEAMIRAPAPVFDRVLLLTPADHRARARQALSAPGGRSTSVLAVQTRENWLCAVGFAAASFGRPTLAFGPDCPGWLDVVPERLARHMGRRIGPARSLACHWSCYLRPGLWPIYRDWLTGGLSLSTLRAADTPPDLRAPPMGPNVAGHAI
ncbi:MAG: hypothetical protein AAF919_03810 [Pseudomonadota bacterium]